jgi:hypothetical protein
MRRAPPSKVSDHHAWRLNVERATIPQQSPNGGNNLQHRYQGTFRAGPYRHQRRQAQRIRDRVIGGRPMAKRAYLDNGWTYRPCSRHWTKTTQDATTSLSEWFEASLRSTVMLPMLLARALPDGAWTRAIGDELAATDTRVHLWLLQARNLYAVPPVVLLEDHAPPNLLASSPGYTAVSVATYRGESSLG